MATSAWTRHITAHWRMKVLALSMSLIAWFVLAYNPATVTRSFRVPIEYRNVPADLSLDHPISEAQLTLSGSAAGFRFVAPESLKISIDLSQTSAGNHTVELGPENIDLPTGVSIESIDPDSLWLYLREAPKKPDGANSP